MTIAAADAVTEAKTTPRRPHSILSSCRFIVASLALLLGSQATIAQPPCPAADALSDQGEMRFTVQQRPGQRPVLIADGIIDQNAPARLQAALEHFDGDEIWLRSPGGYTGADRETGRIVRMRGMRTRIPAGWTCRGGCNFMFLGGVERTVEPGAFFVATMFAHTGNVDNYVDVGGSSQALATADYDFMIRMGVSPRLLSDIMYRQSARGAVTARCLTRAELVEYGVTTSGARAVRERR